MDIFLWGYVLGLTYFELSRGSFALNRDDLRDKQRWPPEQEGLQSHCEGCVHCHEHRKRFQYTVGASWHYQSEACVRIGTLIPDDRMDGP